MFSFYGLKLLLYIAYRDFLSPLKLRYSEEIFHSLNIYIGEISNDEIQLLGYD